MNEYELFYIVSSQYTDAEIEQIKEQVSGEMTTLGGTMVSTKNLGKIRLAYPIKKQHHGSYVLTYFDAPAEVIATLDRKLTLRDDLLRHTLLRRRPGSEKETFELTSYVAPLSEEARRERHKDSAEEGTSRPAPRRRVVEEVAPPTPSSTSSEEKKMSIEELDKKLDELLDADMTKNI
ncbi:30S ribosomal protein S6 [Candidatus Uhrbacteria bacterium]|nr:30S ribosomal protein S6 [Candidatus Uhrbacteria bacterium]